MFYHQLELQFNEHIFDRQSRVFEDLRIVSDRNEFFEEFRKGFVKALKEFNLISNNAVFQIGASRNHIEFTDFVVQHAKILICKIESGEAVEINSNAATLQAIAVSA